MGFELRREVVDLLPRGGVLTDKECRLILELADNCHEQTRKGWPGVEWLADKCDIPNPKRVGEFFASIARKWTELRVELGKDKHGKPYYAKPGQRTVYRIPTRDELIECLGADKVPPTPGLSPRKVPPTPGPKVPATEGPKVPPTPGARSPQQRDPSPQVFPQGSSSKNTSSLSPREDAESATPTSDREREVDASQEQPEPLNPVQRLLIKNGCPAEQVEQVKNRIDTLKNVMSDGWYFTANSNGSLKLAVGEALEDAATGPTEQCGECGDTGTAGDWMNQHPCDCLWWKDPGAARKTFVALLKDFADCEHGMAGGDMKAPNGWQACSLCRGPGWVDKDVQPRTEKTTNNRHYEPWRPPADQSAYDRPFSGQIRSPADRIVADGQALYDHYKSLEEPA